VHLLHHPLPDLDATPGPSALDFLEANDDKRYPRLLAAFRAGYEAHMAWPENRIEPFQIGRLLWKINWVARFKPGSLADMVEQYLPVFAHYDHTGQVILPLV
jgi:hypothetical protein